MKKIYIIAAVVAVLAASCQKEKTFSGMELVAEGFGGGTKAAVSGNASYWVAGETVNINGAAKTVQIEGNTAYVNDVTEAAQYRALYPASLNSSYDGSASSVSVTIPSSYQWAVDGSGRQVLDVPMAAYGTGSDRLVFKHLTAAITVEITNHYGFPVIVDNVTVSSSASGTQYQLCGSKEISLTSSDISVAANASSSNTSVQVTFDGGTSLTVVQGATQRVQVPVLPVCSGNKFSISVTVHKEGNAAVTKTYTKTQTTGGAMARAKMAYAGDTVGFTFSVSASKKVIISQGNLQHVSGSWQFAANQYDVLGTWSSTSCDLFYWETTGNYGANQNCTTPNGTSSDVVNWGVNDITNGGGANQWYTLTKDEWHYLINSRTNNSDKRASATIGTTHGKVLLPDHWTLPAGCSFTAGQGSGWNTNIYSTTDWEKMEAAGAVFLPVTGYRSGTGIGNAGDSGGYWSSTGLNGEYAYLLYLDVSSAYADGLSRYYGRSVRLVKNAN